MNMIHKIIVWLIFLTYFTAQIQPDFSLTCVRYVEVELKLSGIPVQIGLGHNGSRQFVHDIVNSIRGVEIDGFVQRIPVHDLKLVVRGTESDVLIVLQDIRVEIDKRSSENHCEIETIRFIACLSWPSSRSFKILGSASIRAIKSDNSDDKFVK